MLMLRKMMRMIKMSKVEDRCESWPGTNALDEARLPFLVQLSATGELKSWASNIAKKTDWKKSRRAEEKNTDWRKTQNGKEKPQIWRTKKHRMEKKQGSCKVEQATLQQTQIGQRNCHFFFLAALTIYTFICEGLSDTGVWKVKQHCLQRAQIGENRHLLLFSIKTVSWQWELNKLVGDK